MLTQVLLVLFGVLLTVGTGIFVAAEFALVTLDPSAVDRAVDRGDKRAGPVKKSLHHLSTELSGAQIGITLTTILLGYTTQPAVADLLSGWLGDRGMTQALAGAVAVVFALIVVNGYSMIFGELVPKNLALSVPMGTAKLVAPIQRAFTTVMRPLITMLNGSANFVLHRFGVELKEELSGGRSPQELAFLVRRSAEAGTLDQGTARLLTRSIEFNELTAVDVMTDRLRMEVVQRDDSARDVIASAKKTGHSRFPVIDNDRDDIVGVVSLRRAIAVPFDKRDEVPAAALMNGALRVPETVGLGPLMVELRESGTQTAIVVDEYGGTSGMVTLEDVIEEIVGDVTDEHDSRQRGVRAGGNSDWLAPGTMRPDELLSQTGIVVPEDSAYETLGGYVMARLGRIPEVGDLVTTPDGATITVKGMRGRSVQLLSIVPAPVGDDDAAEGGSES